MSSLTCGLPWAEPLSCGRPSAWAGMRGYQQLGGVGWGWEAVPGARLQERRRLRKGPGSELRLGLCPPLPTKVLFPVHVFLRGSRPRGSLVRGGRCLCPAGSWLCAHAPHQAPQGDIIRKHVSANRSAPGSLFPALPTQRGCWAASLSRAETDESDGEGGWSPQSYCGGPGWH